MAATSLLPGLARYRHGTPGRPFRLSRIDPGEQPCGSDDKDADRAAVDELARDLDALQNLFWADKRHKLLVVLQGLDASGKDGTLRHVFGRMSPLGVHAVGWGVPTDAERAHDFLWRIHQRVPAAGEIVVFNRSHYEDVLVPLVGGTLTPAQARLRYAHINDFERMLSDTGTVICKFMLHISKDEQRQRLQERIDKPDKRWKFHLGDLDVRRRWDDYQRAYAQAIGATGTPWAPWTIVPADSKTHRNLMVARVLKATLQRLRLRPPAGEPSVRGLKVR
jgi:PPK2 family polyphosphate:nucleotide phosphotransferase